MTFIMTMLLCRCCIQLAEEQLQEEVILLFHIHPDPRRGWGRGRELAVSQQPPPDPDPRPGLAPHRAPHQHLQPRDRRSPTRPRKVTGTKS